MICVSVVMTVYNEALFLDDAVRSICEQTFGDFELIIIDDGSTDETPHILEAWRKRDARLHVVTQENQGLIASLNRGVALATAPMIARMDGDDVAVATRFEKQVAYMQSHQQVAALGSAYCSIDSRGRLFRVSRPPTQPADVAARLREFCCIAHPTVMMRTAAVREIGGYRSEFVHAEDYDLWLRLSRQYEVANLDEVLMLRRVHEGQVSCRFLRQQVLSTLAAQADDCLTDEAGSESADRRPTQDRINRATAAHYLSRCDDLLRMGRSDLATQLLADLATPPGGHHRWMLARTHWQAGRFGAALCEVVAMLSHHGGEVYAALRQRAARCYNVVSR